MTKKKSEKKVAEAAPTKKVMVNIFSSNYHRYRHWIREILGEALAKGKFRFVKDKIGYTGKIAVEKTEVEKAKKVLADYKLKNKDTVDMWW